MTFFKSTKANFKGCKRPKRKPDYVSYDRYGDISSEYWYTKKGVVRCSDHWSAIPNKYKMNNKTKDDNISKDVCRFSCSKIRTCHWTFLAIL